MNRSQHPPSWIFQMLRCIIWSEMSFLVAQTLHFKLGKPFHLTLLYNAFFQLSFFMAPNFLALATTLENLGARWFLAKKVNFVPCFIIWVCDMLAGSWILAYQINVIPDYPHRNVSGSLWNSEVFIVFKNGNYSSAYRSVSILIHWKTDGVHFHRSGCLYW